jgi:hypothetical protein
MARTAVVAGTANAVVGGMNRGRASRDQAAMDQQAANQAAYEAQAQLAEMQAQMAAQQAPQAAPQAPAGASDMTTKLAELASLHQSGALTDEEFAAAKSKLLG